MLYPGLQCVIELGLQHQSDLCRSVSCWHLLPHQSAGSGGFPPTQQLNLILNVNGWPGEESAKKVGKFLVQSQFQGSVHSSGMFLTGAAQNLLCIKLAAELGQPIASPWVTWLKAAFVPALAGLAITPYLLYKVSQNHQSPHS